MAKAPTIIWPDEMPLGVARVELFNAVVERDEVHRCPCCNRYARKYRRAMNSSMCRALIHILRRVSASGWSENKFNVDGWMHVRKSLIASGIEGNDWTVLRFWGFIVAKIGSAPDGNPEQALYRLTDLGRAFALRQLEAPSHVYLYQNNPYGFDTRTFVKIDAVLQEKFNYSELMAA